MNLICKINDRLRVVEAPDGHQWILQKRAGKRHGRARWDNIGYFGTRDALMAAIRALKAEDLPSAITILESFPARIDQLPTIDIRPTHKASTEAEVVVDGGKPVDPRYPSRVRATSIQRSGSKCPKCGDTLRRGVSQRECRHCGPLYGWNGATNGEEK